ncbi:hypothetical protein I5Q34_08165 [Streptomyces sp. AV19]|uniref:hypothetical protein n=1 Tax=Streptomyces sp. AV19 TaxID=2793068 RepID=UPI0018FE994E|nr:hypothetical protein [Streptomyces sp. AV19]MBH1934269.1 hypothetical protein [Streptomyces sp. AV19]MDG4533421.1 hypothetical protein [Streptomyces sp. AV19]
MTTLDTPAELLAVLLALAAEHQAAVDAADERLRQEREDRERREAVMSARDAVGRQFRNTLAKVLAPEAWRGYPSGGEGQPPMAVAHLGNGIFLICEVSRPVSDPWGGYHDRLILLYSCPCGSHTEVELRDEYVLGFELETALSPRCVGECTRPCPDEE